MGRQIIGLSRPLQLFFAVLTFSLGAGIARYLGHPVRPAVFGLGLLAVLFLQGGAALLVGYFRLPWTPLAQDETPREREKFRLLLLQVSYAALAISAVSLLALLLAGHLSAPAGAIFILAFLVLMAYALPPLRLSGSGYGELLLAFHLATLLPALSFVLQAGGFHRLLSLIAFPLTLLAVAWLLVLNFPTFASDQKHARWTLLIRLTWQRAVPIHHLLVLPAFLLLSAAPFFGLAWRLVWPVFLVLPIAVYQVVWLQRIANGGRTHWTFLTVLAAATFGLTAYLLAATFWMR